MSDLDWPAEQERTLASERRPYPYGFDVSRSRAFESILAELDRMDATNVQLDTGAEHQKRNPNKPYANASFDDPGVVARWYLDGEPNQIAMDKWDNPRDNARAIAKTLEAQRAIPRYGCVTLKEEFKVHQLPPPDEMGDADAVVAGSGSGETPAHDVLGVAPDASDEGIRQAFREIARESHPDVSGDGGEIFREAKDARDAMLDE